MSRIAIAALRVAVLAVATTWVHSPLQAQTQDIEVHGHWVIEVRNADGSLHSRSEFQNALHADGQRNLADLLGRVRPMGIWRVRALVGANGETSFLVTEPGSSTPPSDNVFPNLTMASDGTSVVLQGSFVSNVNADVTGVVSSIEYPDDSLAFTHTEISPVAIANTQTVSVTVTLSFS